MTTKFKTIVLLTLIFLLTFVGESLSKQSEFQLGSHSWVLVVPAFPTILYFGVRSIRKQQHQGHLSFGQALKTALSISLLTAVVASVFYFAYDSLLGQDRSREIIEGTVKNMEAANDPPERVAAAHKSLHFMMNPIVQAIGFLFISGFGGLAASVLVAALIQIDNRNRSVPSAA